MIANFSNACGSIYTNNYPIFSQGLRIKISPNGDIFAKRLSQANIFVHKQPGCSENLHSLGAGEQLRARSFKSSAGSSSNGEQLSNSSGSDLYALNNEQSDFYALNGGNTSNVARSYQGANKTTSNTRFQQQQVADNNKQMISMRNGRNSINPLAQGLGSRSMVSGGGGPLDSSISSTHPDSFPLEFNRPVKIFDMDKFRAILEDESRKACPNRRRLQRLCIAIASFVVDDKSILNLPSWIMIINIVAIDLLRAEFGFLELGPFARQPGPLADAALFQSTSLRHADDDVDDDDHDDDDDSLNQLPELMTYHHHHQPLFHSASHHHQDSDQDLGSLLLIDNNDNRKSSKESEPANCMNLDQYLAPSGHHQRRLNYGSRGGAGARAGANCVINRLNRPTIESQSPLINPGASSSSSSGSSSGFNSHASSQKANSSSSPNSSSSNINTTTNNTKLEPINGDHAPESPEPGFVKAATAKLLASSNAINNNKNFPHLDHCVEQPLQPADNKPPIIPQTTNINGRSSKIPHSIISQPFPIPAPPTSPGSGPSGKANLILVAPTGLSPPIPKRKTTSNHDRDVTSSSTTCYKTPTTNDSTNHQIIPRFSSIKHIDENGHENVIMEQDVNESQLIQAQQLASRANRLPVGIPAHAKLAPPETQKHIIRYLMSATRSKFADLNQQQKQSPTCSTTTITASHQQPSSNYLAPGLMQKHQSHRPLPILPLSKNRKVNNDNHNITRLMGSQVADEALYYRGLQARVTGTRPVARMITHPDGQLANRTVLKDFANGLQQQQQRRQVPPLQLNYLGYHHGQHPKSRPVRYFGSNFDLSRPQYDYSRSKLLKLDIAQTDRFLGSSAQNHVSLKSPDDLSIKSRSMDNLHHRPTSQKSLLNHLLPFSRFRKSANKTKQASSSAFMAYE